MRPRFYIDIAPLQETEYTGIPHVVAKLCEQMLGDDGIEPGFFYNRHEIPIAIVEHLLKTRRGQIIRWAAGRYVFRPPLRAREPGRPVWGLYTNVKFARRMFPVEGCIVHDLTTIVTPEHHTFDANAYHQTAFYGDLMSSDVVFAVSNSTKIDLETYYPDVKSRPVVVTHLGVDWSHIPVATRYEAGETEPFILVLGTLEPRKNIGLVLDLLQQRPEMADRYRFVFGGRVGWGDAFEVQMEKRGLTGLAARGRVLQTGFISEAVKYRMYRQAAAVIYPSVYEGFGLPAAEAISLGAPVVTTASSSLPEVGRGFAHYFRPDSVESLAEAVEAALRRGRSDVSRTGELLDTWRDYFSWPRCYRQMVDAFQRVDADLADKNRAAA